MPAVFVDTSAFYAYLVGSDARHGAAKAAFFSLAERETNLVTHSFVVLETVSLLHNRVGPRAVSAWHEAFADIVDVHWVEEELFDRAMNLYVKLAGKRYSFTDATSFAFMKSENLRRAWCYDDDFMAQGFEVIPTA